MSFTDLFNVGDEYSRQDIYSVLNVPVEKRRGHWETGYARYQDEFFIFVNVEISGRTGHNYEDKWMPYGTLFWHGKTISHLNQPGIKKMLSNQYPCHFFTRNDNRNPRFVYQGVGKALRANDTVPVEIYWEFDELSVNETNIGIVPEFTSFDVLASVARELSATEVIKQVYGVVTSVIEQSGNLTVCRKYGGPYYIVDYCTLKGWNSALKRVLQHIAKTPLLYEFSDSISICIVVKDTKNEMTYADKQFLDKTLSFANAHVLVV